MRPQHENRRLWDWEGLYIHSDLYIFIKPDWLAARKTQPEQHNTSEFINKKQIQSDFERAGRWRKKSWAGGKDEEDGTERRRRWT